MRELSLHILDIVQNSIRAGATEISLKINEARTENSLTIIIQDNGCGMDAETLKQVVDPFYTTRTTRKLGFGVPFYKDTTEQSGGRLEIQSEPGRGTRVQATMVYDHINRPPLGNLAETVQIMVMSNPEIHFVYEHQIDGRGYCLDTAKFTGLLDANGMMDFVRLQALKLEIEQGLKKIQAAENIPSP